MTNFQFFAMFKAEQKSAPKRNLLANPLYREVAAELAITTHPDYRPGSYRIRGEQGGFAVDAMQRDGRWLKCFWRKHRKLAVRAIAEANAA